jgi:hypothetical protein
MPALTPKCENENLVKEKCHKTMLSKEKDPIEKGYRVRKPKNDKRRNVLFDKQINQRTT